MSGSAVPVLVNASGGTAVARGGALEGELRTAFDAAGLTIELQLLRGGEIRAAAAKVAGAPLVVVGGGDGTLGGVAGELAGRSTLGILPLGTRNHLARELGVPLDLKEAAALIARGRTRRIDLARVNGHSFVNNASVGLYPELVRLRDESDLPKKVAAVPAALAALKRLRHHRLRLRLPGAEREVVTPLLFVGNGHYSLERGRIGKRDALDDGALSLYAVAGRSRWALIGTALRTLVGLAGEEDFAALGDAAELTVTGRSSTVDVALDGEVVRLAMPLQFRCEAGVLEVMA